MPFAPRQTGSDLALPLRWRILVAVPPPPQLHVMRAWLDANCGRASWAAALAGTDGVLNDALAFYFVDAAAARAFVDRFSCGYRVAAPPGL